MITEAYIGEPANAELAETVAMTIELPRDVHWRLRCRAAEQGRSVQDEIIFALGGLSTEPRLAGEQLTAIRDLRRSIGSKATEQ